MRLKVTLIIVSLVLIIVVIVNLSVPRKELTPRQIELLREHLVVLRASDKFIEEENISLNPWGYTGAPIEVRQLLQNTMNQSIDNLLKILNNSPTDKKITNQIKRDLKIFSKLWLDTEDKERVCLYYWEMCNIAEIDGVGKILNVWLYGLLGYLER